jgi:hypothetical protein
MADPKSNPWAGNVVSGANLDSTTYGQGTSFPSTWDPLRLFWRTDEKKIYQNTGTEGTPSWTSISGAEIGSLTTATTITPGLQTGAVPIRIDATDLTVGDIEVSIDGSVVDTVASAGSLDRIYSPSTSVSIESVALVNDFENASLSDSFTGTGADAVKSMDFSQNGEHFYAAAGSTIWQYDMSTAWDLTTASYNQSGSAVSSNTRSVALKSDGTKIYTCDSTTPAIKEQDMSTAYDLSTLSLNQTGVNLGGTAQDFVWINSGTQLLLCRTSACETWTASTAWDSSTLTTDSKSYTFPAGSNFYGIDMSLDGKYMIAFSLGGESIRGYSLSTAYDVTTASSNGTNYGVYVHGDFFETCSYGRGGSGHHYIAKQSGDYFELDVPSTFTGEANYRVG